MARCNDCYHFENCEWNHLYAGDDDAWECCDFIRPIDAFFTTLTKRLEQEENKVTVKELIGILEKMPQDLPVFDMGEQVEGCHIVHDHPVGDPCRPGGCPEIDAVYLE